MISNSRFRRPTLSVTFMLTLALIVLSFGGTAMAQETTGSLKGTVVDPNGLAVTGATVTAKSQETGRESSVTTGDVGTFVIPKLNPGKYTLTVETSSGFKKKSVTDLDVRLGENSLGNIGLEVGSPTENVTVVASGEALINRDQAQ